VLHSPPELASLGLRDTTGAVSSWPNTGREQIIRSASPVRTTSVNTRSQKSSDKTTVGRRNDLYQWGPGNKGPIPAFEARRNDVDAKAVKKYSTGLLPPG
jgi:hypothetical protein